jgi:hypothetical protein
MEVAGGGAEAVVPEQDLDGPQGSCLLCEVSVPETGEIR